MIKNLLAISLSAFIVTACGGSSSSGTPSTGNNGGGDNNGGGGGGEPVVVGGQQGDFGDSAAESNGIDATFKICPAGTDPNFSILAQASDSSWCVIPCPSDEAVGNPDGDLWGFYRDSRVCRITDLSPGSEIEIPLTSPIDGCLEGGCGPHPRVYISQDAGTELPGSYTCTTWLFDELTQVWSELSSPAPFALELRADGANISGTETSWSFNSGVLTLDNVRTFINVAVGGESFTSYEAHVQVLRCK